MIKNSRIHYKETPDFWTAEDKKAFLRNTRFGDVEFDRIRPDARHNWLGQAEHAWEEFLPVADKDTKAAKSLGQERAIFKLYSLGVVTNRDEWVYDFDPKNLQAKTRELIDIFNAEVTQYLKSGRDEAVTNQKIKWTRAVKKDLIVGEKYKFSKKSIRDALYRPFVSMHLYYDAKLNEMQYQTPSMFPESDSENKIITFDTSDKQFSALSADRVVDLHFNGDSQCLPLYRYKGGERVDNITDFALKAFRGHYADSSITREQIFHYVYAVLHHPAYREKYALNLRQEFPRVPFYPEFGRWAAWGERLMRLHVDFETAPPFPLMRVDTPPKNGTPEALALAQKARLKADREAGTLTLDGLTTLRGVPPEAWAYRLGNRSALDWVLERHKESTPKDPTIRERFNTYRFADHKERVIDLLARVTTVSVETVRLLTEMPEETV